MSDKTPRIDYLQGPNGTPRMNTRIKKAQTGRGPNGTPRLPNIGVFPSLVQSNKARVPKSNAPKKQVNIPKLRIDEVKKVTISDKQPKQNSTDRARPILRNTKREDKTNERSQIQDNFANYGKQRLPKLLTEAGTHLFQGHFEKKGIPLVKYSTYYNRD